MTRESLQKRNNKIISKGRSAVIVAFLLLAIFIKFNVGYYEFNSPPQNELFVKTTPVWKSIFYSPLNKENKTYSELTEQEKYEQKMFESYAYEHLLSNLQLVSCGDIFSRFSTKPHHLEYIGCENPIEDSQTLVVAKYRVSGENAPTIEDYLIQYHQMPPMKILGHTGYENIAYEPDGYGKIKNSLSRINPYMDIYIDMRGYAKKEVEYDKYGSKLDDSVLKKEEVPYFYVNVSIIEI